VFNYHIYSLDIVFIPFPYLKACILTLVGYLSSFITKLIKFLYLHFSGSLAAFKGPYSKASKCLTRGQMSEHEATGKQLTVCGLLTYTGIGICGIFAIFRLL